MGIFFAKKKNIHVLDFPVRRFNRRPSITGLWKQQVSRLGSGYYNAFLIGRGRRVFFFEIR